MRRSTLILLMAMTLIVAACTSGNSDETTTSPAPTTIEHSPVSATAAPSTTSDTSSTTSTMTASGSTTTAESTTTTQYVSPVSEGASLPPAQPRTAIPWSDVDEDWLLALYEGLEAEVLYLVSPDSDLFEITSWDPGSHPPRTLADWSPGLRHVLIRRFNPMPAPALELQILDLESGEVSAVESVPYSFEREAEALTSLWGKFTMPTGRNLMVFKSVDGVASLDRRTPAGTVLTTFDTVGTWLYSLAGTEVVIGDGNGLHLYSNDGVFVRDLPVDREGTPMSAVPLRWWSDDTLLAATHRPGDPQARGHASWGDVGLVTVGLSSNSVEVLDGEAGVPGGRYFEGAWAIDDRILIETVGGRDHYQRFWQTFDQLSFDDDYGNHRVLGTTGGDLIVFAFDPVDDRGLIARYDVESAPGEPAELIQVLVPQIGNAKGVVEGLFQDTIAAR